MRGKLAAMDLNLSPRTGARLFALAALALLSACTPPPPYGPPPPGAGPTFVYPMRLVGTEPFWGATISETRITLSGVDRPETSFPAGERRVTGAGASWSTRSPTGTTLHVDLVRETCSDGMSDRVYPFRAAVHYGAETLNGCAMSEAEFMSGPRP